MEIYLRNGKMDGASGLSSGYCRLPPPSPLPLLSLLLLFLVSPSPFPSCAVRISSWVSWLLIPFPGLPALSVPRDLHFLLDLFTSLFLLSLDFPFALGQRSSFSAPLSMGSFLPLPLDLRAITSYSFFLCVPGSLPFLSLLV